MFQAIPIPTPKGSTTSSADGEGSSDNQSLRECFRDRLGLLEGSSMARSTNGDTVYGAFVKSAKGLESNATSLEIMEAALTNALGFQPNRNIDRDNVADVKAERDRLFGVLVKEYADAWPGRMGRCSGTKTRSRDAGQSRHAVRCGRTSPCSRTHRHQPRYFTSTGRQSN